MHGNPKMVFKRGIVNHTAFKFCIEGYPFNTTSKRIYSVSDLPEIKNKNTLYKYYLKNIDALISFLGDLSFDKQQYYCKEMNEIKVLKNAYGVMIALIGLYAEHVLNEQYFGSSFTSIVPPRSEELKIENEFTDYRVTTTSK